MVRVADYIIQFLENKGIKFAFEVTGGGAMFLNDAVAKSNITPIFCHHEQACAMAAVGYSKTNNEVSLIIPTTGCGSTNTITGILDAWQDSNRVIIISGQVNKKDTTYLKDIPLRKLGVQEVNIIDIGVGDSRPVKEFVEKFVDQNILEGYIGLDISKEMLKKSETNMKEWFGEKLKTEYYLKDINKDYFADIIFKKSNIRDKEIQNLVLFVETTIENQIDFNKTLVNIKDSLGKDDLALIMFSLDTLESRSYYDYWSKSNTETMKIPNQIKWIPDLLNLTEDNYTSNSDYDSAKGLRVASIRLNTDIDLEFNFSEGNLYKKIHLPKNTDIRLWQHSHHKISSLLTKLNNLGLDLQFLANSKNQAQAILLLKKSGIKEIHNSIDTLNYD